jgi:hypothetical protein
MKWKSVILVHVCLLVSSFYSAEGQAAGNFPSLTKDDLPEAQFTGVRTFSGESLYGYIDGGADLYLEYGFSGVQVTELTLQKKRYKIEVYRMKEPEAAYGIFSVSRFRCRSRPDFTQHICLNRYQLQFCRGDYYINIVNEGGTEADSVNSVKIGSLLNSRTEGRPADLLNYLPGEFAAAATQNAVLVKGRLGIANGAPEYDKYFRNARGYNALIFSAGDKTFISVRFDSEDDLNLFMELRNWAACSLGVNEIKMQGGESLRLTGENHLVIGVNN